MNSCKQVSQIKYVADNGIQMMTFDSEVELMKVARAHPKAKLVLCVATDDSKAVCHLSVKFGTRVKISRLLLEWTKELNIDFIGVSFHMENVCTDPETFMQAVSDACCVFDMVAEVYFHMYLLDVGGSFSGSEDVVFELIPSGMLVGGVGYKAQPQLLLLCWWEGLAPSQLSMRPGCNCCRCADNAGLGPE